MDLTIQATILSRYKTNSTASSMNMTDNSKLCRVCRLVISTNDLNASIYNSDVNSDDGSSADVQTVYAHHSNDHDLRASAQAGCPLCTILWDFFSDREHFTKLKGASFVFSLHYDGEANAEKHPWLPRVPYYRFNMRYKDSPPVDTNAGLKLLADNINIYALGVESELIHNYTSIHSQELTIWTYLGRVDSFNKTSVSNSSILSA